MAANPIIFVHGIQGSWLKDEYPVNYQDSILWTGILTKRFEALALHAVDTNVDASPRRMIRPHQAVPLIYESIVEEIRDELGDDNPYVYAFTYDWRKDNRQAADELALFVDRVLAIAGTHEKTRKRTKPKKVTLIGHSMGGLVIKWFATKTLSPVRAKSIIDKIITIASPFGGSLKAVEAILPGARKLFGGEHKKSMRHASRTMPGVYQLLPTWKDAVVRTSDNQPLDIFKATSWQKSLVENLSNKYGKAYFQRMLTDAKSFTSAVSKPWPQWSLNKVYTMIGINTPTWWQVPVDTTKDNFFQFGSVKEGGAISPIDSQGDGTVHVVSSYRPELSNTHRAVDITERLWDAIPGHHANMPNRGKVQDWILGILKINPHSRHSFVSIT